MATVMEQIRSADAVICRNIELQLDDRSILSQNILSQLRNLVQGVAVLLQTRAPDSDFDYEAIKPAVRFIRSQARFNFLRKFHDLLQISTSHYTLDGDASERLMLKYYEYLFRLRTLLWDEFGEKVLENLEDFPLDLDPSLREYHQKISERIQTLRSSPPDSDDRHRYYVHKIRPFFVDSRVYYEVTLYPAINRVSKFDRFIAFSDVEMTDKYAAMLRLSQDSIEVLGQTMPITIIHEWSVSIRPCEFNNFGRLLGISTNVRSNSREYRNLMRWLTRSHGNLVDVVQMQDGEYAALKNRLIAGVKTHQITTLLDKARDIVRSAAPGHNVLRYLLLRMHNKILKPLHKSDGCRDLSDLRLQYGCIPFDTMPFCTSLPRHNPRYWDLIESLDLEGRTYEVLARRVKNNVERHGMLYTPVTELTQFRDIGELIRAHNDQLYFKHTDRQLELDRGYVFIRGYEDGTVTIIEKLKEYASSGIAGYTQSVERWLNEKPQAIDDPDKENALKQLFSQSRVAVLYGAAGTGKSTMVNHLAHYFHDKSKLFLAHTNPAVDNLRRKVTADNSEFRTIHSHIHRSGIDPEYDLLVIDECSTVSNAALLRILEQTRFKLLVLVGDIYQIESIQFGNWFGIIRSFLPETAVFELTRPFRTKNNVLISLWQKVRNIDDDLAEWMVRQGYSSALDETLFEPQGQDEIILCLNYDGLYGINNINRFLQSRNSGKATTWGVLTYKVGDPVLFHDTERFRPVIYNNLKGRIVGIKPFSDRIQFDIEVDRPLNAFDVEPLRDELEWIENSVVRFSVFEYDNGESDDESDRTTVPFQVAYAVSIHKAQGLEYDSVKIVITDANEEDITHNIFYTGVTRARERLRIYWTPEVQQGVLTRLRQRLNGRDVSLLLQRRELARV